MVTTCFIMLSNAVRRLSVNSRRDYFKLTCREQLRLEWTSITYYQKSRPLHASILIPATTPVKFTHASPHFEKGRSRQKLLKQDPLTYSAWNSHSNVSSDTFQCTSDVDNSLTEHSQGLNSDPDTDGEDKLSNMDSKDFQLPCESRKYPSRQANIVKVVNLFLERVNIIRRTASENGLEGTVHVLSVFMSK